MVKKNIRNLMIIIVLFIVITSIRGNEKKTGFGCLRSGNGGETYYDNAKISNYDYHCDECGEGENIIKLTINGLEQPVKFECEDGFSCYNDYRRYKYLMNWDDFDYDSEFQNKFLNPDEIISNEERIVATLCRSESSIIKNYKYSCKTDTLVQVELQGVSYTFCEMPDLYFNCPSGTTCGTSVYSSYPPNSQDIIDYMCG